MTDFSFLGRIVRPADFTDGERAELFNCCTNNAEPKWRYYTRLEIDGCRNDGDPMPGSETMVCAGQDVRSAEFFTIYGRRHPDEGIELADAITDVVDARNLIRIAAALALRSGLPVTFSNALISTKAPEPSYSTEAAADAMALWEAFLSLTHNAKGDADAACETLLTVGTAAMREDVLAAQPHFETIWRTLRHRHEHVTDGNSYDWEIAPVMIASAAKFAVRDKVSLPEAAEKHAYAIMIDVLAAFPDREG